MFQKVSVQLVSVYSEAFYSSTDHKSGAILVTKTTINTAMTTTAAKTTSPLGCIIAILLKRICCWGAVCDSPLSLYPIMALELTSTILKSKLPPSFVVIDTRSTFFSSFWGVSG